MKKITLLLLLLVSYSVLGQINPNQPTKFNNGISLPNATEQNDADTLLVQKNGKINGYILKDEFLMPGDNISDLTNDLDFEENVQSDWDESDSALDAYILNKPSETNFNVYNQYEDVVINTTSNSSMIIASTGATTISNMNENASYIGEIYGNYYSTVDGEEIDIEFIIGNRTIITETITNSTQDDNMPIHINYTINFFDDNYARITVSTQNGTYFHIWNEENPNDINVGSQLEINATLTGGTLTTYSSYLHKNVQ